MHNSKNEKASFLLYQKSSYQLLQIIYSDKNSII